MMSLGYYALRVPKARYLINSALSLKDAVWGVCGLFVHAC